MSRVVIDTSILVSAIMSKRGASRAVLRMTLEHQIQPIIGNALFQEYEDVMARETVFKKAVVSAKDRQDLLNALLSVCEWVPIYFLWRPNLPDEADNHLIELAVAGGARTIITGNKKDVSQGELLFPNLSVQTAAEYLTERKAP